MFGYVDNYDFFNMEAEKYWSPNKNLNLKKLVNDAIKSGLYIGSRKVDGHWYMAIKDEDGNISLRGRTKSVTGEYVNKIDWVPHLKETFQFLPAGTVLIGELYFPNKEGSRYVTTIMGCLKDKAVSRQKEHENKLNFYIFDILAISGKNIMDSPLSERLKYRNHLFSVTSNLQSEYIQLATYYKGEDLLNYIYFCKEKGYEGVVLQNISNTYEPGKRTARKTIKVKKELDNEIDCFLTGKYFKPTWEYTGNDIENWTYWFNTKTYEKVEGKFFNDWYAGEPLQAISKGAFYGWAGAVELGVLKDGEVYPICQISNVTEDIKKGIVDNNDLFTHKVCKVSAMMIEEDSQKLRHAKIMEWRDDIPWEDCTWEKVFGDKK